MKVDILNELFGNFGIGIDRSGTGVPQRQSALQIDNKERKLSENNNICKRMSKQKKNMKVLWFKESRIIKIEYQETSKIKEKGKQKENKNNNKVAHQPVQRQHRKDDEISLLKREIKEMKAASKEKEKNLILPHSSLILTFLKIGSVKILRHILSFDRYFESKLKYLKSRLVQESSDQERKF
ncbi:hypothetical protein RFI_18069 [Reticulomyxa filosa]|uniref:Uncharacterized protein n=1 Tax=Reticulomyxa filosa TaxID=46433 RepID=X6MZS3_RETFI|nr:hypothetical protein RFI_18069 [Reticulomyxa filosa]|eukprot:ETO19153.1 hypothetical protein RFI_18069 [Reticulomyxa filosa]